MIIKYEKTAAFICPFCSALSRRKLSAFDFSGSHKTGLFCSTPGCREECAEISLKGDHIKIHAECPICGDSHSYTTNSAKFWSKNIMSYKCPVSGVDIIMCGDDKTVERAIAENCGEYREFIPDFDDNSEESELLYDIVDCVHELNSDHRISCVCGSDSVSIQIMNNSLVLICDKCRRVRVIETNEHNLAMLLNAEAIVIGS